MTEKEKEKETVLTILQQGGYTVDDLRVHVAGGVISFQGTMKKAPQEPAPKKDEPRDCCGQRS